MVVGISIPLGIYMKKVYSHERTFMSRLIGPIENFIYKILRINPLEEMNWKQYAGSLLVFNVLGIFILLAILMSQKYL
ncbi:MAG: potassium-transporting ATPase subunit KdpA, partial [Nitrososphaeraceae archaeon]